MLSLVLDVFPMICRRPKMAPPVEEAESEPEYLAPRILPSSDTRPQQPHYDEVPDGPRSRSASPRTRTSADWISTDVIPEERNIRDPRKMYKTEATIRLSDKDNNLTTSL